MKVDEMIAVLQASKEAGVRIQLRRIDVSPEDKWKDCVDPVWDFSFYEYRVAPKAREWWEIRNRTSGVHLSSNDSYDLAFKAREYFGWNNCEIIHVRELLEGEE